MPDYPFNEFTIWEYDAYPLSHQRWKNWLLSWLVHTQGLQSKFTRLLSKLHWGVEWKESKMHSWEGITVWRSDSISNYTECICKRLPWKNKYFSEKKKVSRTTGCAIFISWHFEDQSGQRSVIVTVKLWFRQQLKFDFQELCMHKCKLIYFQCLPCSYVNILEAS